MQLDGRNALAQCTGGGRRVAQIDMELDACRDRSSLVLVFRTGDGDGARESATGWRSSRGGEQRQRALATAE